MTNEQKANENIETTSNLEVFNELKRRVDLTRRARIKASDRLRNKHEFYEKTSYFYSLIILALSVWFIDSSGNMPKVLLIASLSLTFFTMFLGVKNYKERASNFENNYQQLNVLLNKMQRLEANPDEINQEKLKELHRDYEKLIIDKENHIDIDYKTCKPEHEEKYKIEIMKYNRFEKTKRFFVFWGPIILVTIYLIKKVITLFI